MEVRQPRKISARTHLLTPLPKQEFKLGKHVFFDIETGLPGENTLGGTWLIGQARFFDQPHKPYYFYDEGQFLDFCLSKKMRGHTLVAHNGHGYDYAYLMKYIRDHKDDYPGLTYKILLRGDGRPILISLKYKKQVVKLVDSFNVIQSSLAALTKVLAPEYAKKERSWTKNDGSINYFDITSSDDMEYLDYDVLGLLHSYERYCKIVYDNFGVNLALTSASTAMKAWRRTLPDNEHGYFWRQRPEVENFARRSYAGGIVFLTTIDTHYDMYHLDVNAMYAHAMRKGVPLGAGAYTDKYRLNKPGIYHCIAHVPMDEKYPFIPDEKNRWACGTFSCHIPSITIEYARSLGYVIDVIDGYVFDNIGYIYNDFLDMCEKLEREHKSNGKVDSVGLAAKTMRNSLYGKFGMKPISNSINFGEIPEMVTPFVDQNNIPSDCLYETQEELQTAYMMVHWSAWITAQARIHLNTLARATEAIYGDTDSIVIPAHQLQPNIDCGLIELGEQYGALKLEAHYDSFTPLGPKRYRGLTDSKKKINKAKGIPKDHVSYDDNHKDTKKVVWYTSVNSIPTIIKSEKGMTTYRQRRYSDIKQSKTWQVLGNNAVRPRISEFHQNMRP